MQEQLQKFLSRYRKLADRMVNGGSVSVGLGEDFYLRFEDRFRGAPDKILTRLDDRYRKLISAVAKTTHRALDLGCGRGEFLDLARQTGFATVGADISETFVRHCIRKGHQATNMDSLSFLKRQADQSYDLVASFHVVEHCSMDYNFEVFRQVRRVLANGGIFIVETPNLFSMWAGHRQFYLDPTHERPVHPELMQFMCETAGFSRVDLMSFDEVEHPERARLSAKAPKDLQAEFIKLEKWLYGPMDIAIIAVK
jgi:O-antigen chain-terminating methyltransferase